MEIMRGWRIVDTQTTVQTKTFTNSSNEDFTNNNNKILSSIIIDPKEGTSKQFNDANQSIYVSFLIDILSKNVNEKFLYTLSVDLL